MRDDVIKGIQSMKGITNVIVLTFNIDFLFIQTMLFSVMRKCGNPSLTILGDADSLSHQFQSQSRYLSGLGRRYRTIPVRMEQGFRFHPKAILLSGEDNARLYIGSGNCTYAGWRQNAEIWSLFDTDADPSVFLEFKEYLQMITGYLPDAEVLKSEIDAAYLPEKHWVQNLEEGPSRLISQPSTDGITLLSQMVQRVQREAITRIIVSSPYFDEDLFAIAEVRQMFPLATIEVLFNGRGTNLASDALERFPSGVTLKKIKFIRSTKDEEDGSPPPSAFIHAKFYAFIDKTGNADVFAGSANSSVAALLLAGRRGNAELMTHARMTEVEFEKEFLQELEILDEPPSIHSDHVEETEKPKASTRVHVHSARYEYGTLHVHFSMREEHTIKGCFLDGKPVAKWEVNGAILATEPTGEPAHVQLSYHDADGEQLTAPLWIDYEHDLSSLSSRRTLSELLSSKSGQTQVAPSFFLDVIRSVEKELQEVTIQRFGRERSVVMRPVNEATFTFADLRSKGYDVAQPGHYSQHSSRSDYGFNDMLLRFMMHGLHRFEEEAADPETQEELEERLARGDRENPRTREESPPPPRIIDLDKAMRIKIRKHIDGFTKLLTSEAVLSQRPLEHLRIDIKIAGGLLLTAYGHGWLKPEEFSEATARIWTALFLTGPGKDTRGWLRVRSSQAGLTDDFFMDSSITAMLLAWYSVIEPMDLPEYTHMVLAGALSASRYPGLWFGASYEERRAWLESIAGSCLPTEELSQFLQRCDRNGADLMIIGEALDALERRLNIKDFGELRKAVESKSESVDVHIGDLMWQGQQHGYCISRESFQSRVGETRKVYCLSSAKPEKQFGPAYMLLLNDLLIQPEVLTPRLEKEKLDALSRFQKQLRNMPLPLIAQMNNNGRKGKKS